MVDTTLLNQMAEFLAKSGQWSVLLLLSFDQSFHTME